MNQSGPVWARLWTKLVQGGPGCEPDWFGVGQAVDQTGAVRARL